MPALDGSGINVAVLDSGMVLSRYDLKGQVLALTNFNDTTNEDNCGHGTHIGGIIAGSRDNSVAKKGADSPDKLQF
jgi:thermitase